MRRVAGLLGLALAVVPASAGDGRWIHVRVDEDKAGGARVDVQLPLTMVAAVLPSLKTRHFDADLELGGSDVSLDELRGYWKAVREARDGRYVTVRDDGDTVRISKRAGMVHVDVTGSQKVTLRLPVAVVEAFLGTGDTLDVDGLVRALGSAPSGELIAVDDDGSRVRIWIDDRPEPGREDTP